MKYKNNNEMVFLPVSLNITGKKILIIGGGKVAAHKMEILSRFTNNITILAPDICDIIGDSNFTIIHGKYHASHLEEYYLVYACTDNHLVNEKIKKEANQLGILINVADNPELCDFVSPAIYKKGDLTVAVGSNACNVKQSIAIRNKVQNFLEKKTIPDKSRESIIHDHFSFPAENPEIKKLPYSFNEGIQKEIKEPILDVTAPGKVMLVGFGPGNPELLTIKALSCLHEADVIFYDALLDSNYLSEFEAVKVSVGKRCGHHSKKQDEINELLLEAARNGKKVVRLKGGDPMIFGRGGEELNFLISHNIEVEVIPGITSALAASAQYGISMTHRLISSSVAFCHGHKLSSKPFPMVDTLVIYMGANYQREIAIKLISEGWKAETPVALLSRISFPDSKSVITSLEKLSYNQVVMEMPLLIIVGNTIMKRLL